MQPINRRPWQGNPMLTQLAETKLHGLVPMGDLITQWAWCMSYRQAQAMHRRCQDAIDNDMPLPWLPFLGLWAVILMDRIERGDCL